MKKIIVLILSMLTAMSISACGSQIDTTVSDSYQDDTVSYESSNEGVCEHTWNLATCTSPKVCSKCNVTEGTARGHSWSEATCQNPKKCAICGITEGSAKGHLWSEANCQSPKKCSTCGITEGNNGECKDDGSGKCKLCRKDLTLNKIKEGLTLQLIVPSVGASNNYYFTVKYVNQTGYTVVLDRFVTANGKLCDNSQAEDYQLPNNRQIPIPYYSSRYDMYLDNASLAYTNVEINGKTYFFKFGVNGITDIGYSLQDIDVY